MVIVRLDDWVIFSECQIFGWGNHYYQLGRTFRLFYKIGRVIFLMVTSSSFLLRLSFCSTFFREFHKGLVQTIRCLLKEEGPSEAIMFSPKRGDSLDKFLVEVKDSGLNFSITEMYENEIWRRHQRFINGDNSWPNYDKDHCYPLFIRITRWTFFHMLPEFSSLFLSHFISIA